MKRNVRMIEKALVPARSNRGFRLVMEVSDTTR